MRYSVPRLPYKLFALAAFVLILIFHPSASYAQGTLNNETLKASGINPSAFNVTSLNCVPNGISSFSFTSTGIATGPYPGTYVENGTISFDNNLTTGAPRPILSFSSTFTITSGSTIIRGSKELAPSPAPPLANNGVCQQLPSGTLTVDSLSVNFAATYTATIPTGTNEPVIEEGASRVVGSVFRAYTTNPDGSTTTVAQSYSFNETFINPTAVTRVTLTPARATNPVGTSHTVTATATTAAGTSAPGTKILFTVTPGDGSTLVTGSCTTDSSGQCTFTYQGPEFPRSDAIRGCADSNTNGTTEPTEPCGAATKEFLLPVSTPGQVTGGGQILDAQTSISGITFSFNFRSDGVALQGNCMVNDKARDTMVRCADVLAFVQVANHATIYGNAEVNGAQTLFKMEIFDNAEPGIGRDVFSILTQNGYAASGVLTQGNIQAHQPQ